MPGELRKSIFAASGSTLSPPQLAAASSVIFSSLSRSGYHSAPTVETAARCCERMSSFSADSVRSDSEVRDDERDDHGPAGDEPDGAGDLPVLGLAALRTCGVDGLEPELSLLLGHVAAPPANQ